MTTKTKPNIVKYETIDSTNSFAMKTLENIGDKTVIIAKQQTNGRGRFDRVWVSENSQNLYASIVLKPQISDLKNSNLANLTQYMSVKLAELFEEYGVEAQIKWPNDVLVGGFKISGILSEVSFQGSTLKGFVLGFGVNLNMSEEELKRIDKPATSLGLLLQKRIDVDEFAERIINKFFEHYEEFLAKGFSFIKEDYIKRCSFLGKEISVKNLNDEKIGIAEQITDEGFLLLNCNGEKDVVVIGDILCI